MPPQSDLPSLFVQAMKWFFTKYSVQEVDSNEMANRVRHLLLHLDYALQETAEKYAGASKNLNTAWPELLKKICGTKLRNGSLSNRNLRTTLYGLEYLYGKTNKMTHSALRPTSDIDLSDYIDLVEELLQSIEEKHIDNFWSNVTSQSATKATDNLGGLGYLFLILEVFRTAEGDSGKCRKLEVWFGKQNFFHESTRMVAGFESTWRNDLSLFLAKIMDSDAPFATILNLVDEIGLPNYESFSAYYNDLKKSADDEGKKLPPVMFWAFTGEDISYLELTIQKSRYSECEVLAGPLKKLLMEAINTAENNFREKPVLQIEFDRNLFFELKTEIAKMWPLINNSLLKSCVSGIVFCPLRVRDSSWLHVKPIKPRGPSKLWYCIEKLDSKSNTWNCRERSTTELGKWISKENKLHVYLAGMEAIKKNWGEICDNFSSCIFFGMDNAQENFIKFEAESSGSALKVESLAENLRDLQIENFENAPIVFWQHKERSSKFSEEWELQESTESI